MLGHTLVPALRAFGFDAVAHGHSEGLDVSADTTEPDSAANMLNQVRPGTIINLVALTNADTCEEQPNNAYRLNVRSVESLVNWIARNRNCRLIQISTDQVYDGKGPHQEANVVITNTYGLSKYAGELAALRTDATVLRTNYFGPSRLARRPSFSDWLIAKLRAREPFIGFDDVLFSPLSMDTLSKMVVRVIQTPVPGVYNLGSCDGQSKAAFAVALATHFDLDASGMRHGSSSEVKLKAYRPSDMRMDCGLFETKFGVKLPSLQAEIEQL
jgi:dTDP-4-dehydrorhamnose reductase